MALILCEDGDPAAAWAAARLCRRGVAAELLASSQLGDAVRWEHRLDAGAASIAITLADGRVLSSDAAVPILNRLGMVPLRPLRATFGKDYGYAVQELSAFYLSWLHAWPATVVNRPVPQGLCGRHRHASQWTALGAAAGLETLIWAQSSDDPPDLGWAPRQPAEATAFVVAGRPLLPPVLPAALARPLARLAALAGTALIGIDFVRDPGRGWIMIGGSPAPNLMLGGEPLIDALAATLAA
jgi:hypothetical protein